MASSNEDLFYSQVSLGYKALDKLDSRLGNKKYDIIISHEVFRSGFAGLQFQRSDENVLRCLDVVEYPVFSERSSLSVRQSGLKNYVSNSLTAKYAKNIASMYDLVFASSPSQLSFYQDVIPPSSKVVMNCRERDLGLSYSQSGCINLRHRFALQADDILIAYSNRMYSGAGMHYLLESLSCLEARFKLIVVGEVASEITDEFQSLVVRYGLEKRVFITGMLDPKCVLSALSQCDIGLCLLEGVVKNHSTALPNRLFDLIEAGLPTISFVGGEVGELVNRYGIGVSVTECSTELKKGVLDCVKKFEVIKKNVQAARFLFSWDVEKAKVVEAVLESKRAISSVLIIANKNIERNDRVKRLSSLFMDLGCQVDVFCVKEPLVSMKVEGVAYYS